ncbi:MAG TPA: hypothetical protein VMU77_01525, partial [Acidimicrobiales bacterium]|nr:hypothetical protein [Acidimicrobiales bacterium]
LGRRLDEVLDEMKMVAEGVKTAPVAVRLGELFDVGMPISSEIAKVISGESTAGQAVAALLNRETGAEMEGIEMEGIEMEGMDK